MAAAGLVKVPATPPFLQAAEPGVISNYEDSTTTRIFFAFIALFDGDG